MWCVLLCSCLKLQLLYMTHWFHWFPWCPLFISTQKGLLRLHHRWLWHSPLIRHIPQSSIIPTLASLKILKSQHLHTTRLNTRLGWRWLRRSRFCLHDWHESTASGWFSTHTTCFECHYQFQDNQNIHCSIKINSEVSEQCQNKHHESKPAAWWPHGQIHCIVKRCHVMLRLPTIIHTNRCIQTLQIRYFPQDR